MVAVANVLVRKSKKMFLISVEGLSRPFFLSDEFSMTFDSCHKKRYKKYGKQKPDGYVIPRHHLPAKARIIKENDMEKISTVGNFFR